MKKIIICILFITVACGIAWMVNGGKEDFQEKASDPTVEVIKPIPDKSDHSNKNSSISLSLDEKIGQMMFIGIAGTSLTEGEKRLITNYHVGGIILFKENLTSPEQAKKLIDEIKQLNKKNNKIPLFLGIDEEGGRITRLPGDLTPIPTMQELGNINDPDLTYEIGTLIGKQVKEYGFNVDFAPVMDVNSNPNNPIIGDRSFGDNPELVTKHGIQVMKGIQSENVISVIKHFPGHGDTSVDSHLDLPTVNKSMEELQKLELIPFKEAIQEGTDMVMIAHILLPKIDSQFPSSMSKTIITDVLRKKLHYDGVVITDDMTMKAISNRFLMEQAAVQSVKAGSDIVLVAHDEKQMARVMNELKQAVHEGEISEERIDKSVDRIVKLKKKYKIVENDG